MTPTPRRIAMWNLLAGLALAAVIALALLSSRWQGGPGADDGALILASTTSTEASGLFAHLLPKFEAATGIEIHVVAKGTGAALEMARRGDADILLVHHPEGEKRLVAKGHGTARHPVMYNDFVLIGPQEDPAEIAGITDAAAALDAIARARAPFLSRGDDSGTHRKEHALWRAAGRAPWEEAPRWYRETGAGMGATLNTAAAMGAYSLADRGTWLAFDNRQELTLLVEGDPRLHNPYAVIPVDPARHGHVDHDTARRFARWLTGPEGQAAIAGFRIEGEPLFHPLAAAAKTDPEPDRSALP